MYPPAIAGWALMWYDAMTSYDPRGPGSRPYEMWNAYTGPGLNTVEKQLYDASHDVTKVVNFNPNVPMGGTDQLFILPQKSDKQWRSARLEGKDSHACPDGKKMLMEAKIRLGTASKDKQVGVWPAFWAIGESQRKGVEWPACGEWDIMETTDGQGISLGTLWYGIKDSSGAMGQHTLQTGENHFDYTEYHKWGIMVDRTSSNWRDQSVTFLMDGNSFGEIKGDKAPSEDVWNVIAKQGYFPVLNVAIGSQFPGGKPDANDQTGTGQETGMAVNYVAVYVSS